MRALLCLPVVALLALPAAGAERVRVGVAPTLSTAGMFIAKDRGYFAREGLDVELISFPSSGPEMVPALATGDLDVGAGNISAKLYNAMARGIALRIVADKGSNLPGCGYLAIVGRSRVPARGLRIAVTGPGVSQEIVVDRWLRRAGLGIADVSLSFLSYQDAAVALATGAIDVTVQIEPLLSEMDPALVIDRACHVYPYQQSAVVVYSESFAAHRRDAGERFMRAYLRGVRDYRRAFVTRKASADALVGILAKWLPVRLPEVLRRAAPVGLNPDGFVNVASMKADLRWYEAHGYIKDAPDLDRFVDHSFVKAALRTLGPG